MYRISFPSTFRIIIDINGLKFELEDIASVRNRGRWTEVEFPSHVLAQLLVFENCKVIVEKYRGVKYEYDCREFVEYVKTLGGEE
jgi:hypothetical protein